MTILAPARELETFVAAIFRAAGSEAGEAAEIAAHLVDANLAGHDSHGVGMVPAYLLHLASGFVHPNRRPLRVGGAGPFAVFDGQMGYGQPMANRVMDEAIAIAAEHGVAIVSLRNAQHIGRVGAYAERLAARGLLSIHFVNAVYTQPCVAPHRGSEARLMTNPVCIALPGEAPVLLDFATSAIAMGKARVAWNKAEPVAPGRLIDHTGQATTSPAVLFEEPRGALLPFGEHKGWGLAFLAEVLGGALGGGPVSGQRAMPQQGLVNGMFTIALEPGRLGDASVFADEVSRLANYVKSSPAASPDEPVLVPGEPERASREQRGRDGIPIDPTTWKQISDGAAGLGVAAPAFLVRDGA